MHEYYNGGLVAKGQQLADLESALLAPVARRWQPPDSNAVVVLERVLV